MCVRHVAEQEARIARQEILIERLRKIGSPLLDDAFRLPDVMQDLLKSMREHAARLSN
jgi:hypothetical protein